MSWSSQKSAFFVAFILFEGNFCDLSQCIVYWRHLQNIHTFKYQKALLHTVLLLIFKIVESLQCILNGMRINRWLHLSRGFWRGSPSTRIVQKNNRPEKCPFIATNSWILLAVRRSVKYFFIPISHYSR